MDRFVRLVFVVFVVFFAVVFADRADALTKNFTVQSAAFSQCSADLRQAQSSGYNKDYLCWFESVPVFGSWSGCSSPLKQTGGRYVLGPQGVNAGFDYVWCVPDSCSAGTDDATADKYAQWNSDYSEGDVACNQGCLSKFRFPPTAGAWSVSSPDGSLNGAWGYWEKNGGGRCASVTDSTMLKAKFDEVKCSGSTRSCYDPKKGYCYVTEYGEQICNDKVPGPGNPSGGCTAGATGAVCTGSTGGDQPKPDDPPIRKDQPPDTTQQSTTKDSGGNTYNNTTNNYSGMSPGGSDPSKPPPSADSQSGGSQSNTGGSGNSPGPNGGKGTGADGKCSDGSVPTASGCSGTYTDNGCDAPPQCFGDAVMCGANRELHAIKCNTQPGKASSSGNYGDVGSALAGAGVPADGGASGDPDPSSLVSVQDIGQDGFDSSGLGFSRTCPASPQFEFWGRTYTIDVTPLCNFASMFGWFVLLLSYLAGLRIVSTGKA